MKRLTCILLVLVMMMGAMALAEGDAPIEISTVEELAAINDNLSGNYVLTADIDLGGVEWTPIGAYAPSGESEEEQEIPSAETAFTGTFDGQGHTISNLVINQPEAWAQGLFGCAANAQVGNFTLENATVDAQLMGAGVVGYAYCSTVSSVTLKNGRVTAHAGEMSGEGMYGGIVGAGMGSMIENCAAQADIVLPDGTANAGIVGGGLEMTSVMGCAATGTVTAGNDCYGLGGVSGCGFAAEQFTDCTAENVTITTGDNCFWIGGITGYAGGYPDAQYGMPVTVFTNCTAKNVTEFGTCIRAKNAVRNFGEGNPILGYQMIGQRVVGAPTVWTDATAESLPGTYTIYIEPGTITATENVVYVPAVLTVEGDITGIETVANDKNEATPIYTLEGKRASSATQGLKIQSGKVVLVR